MTANLQIATHAKLIHNTLSERGANDPIENELHNSCQKKKKFHKSKSALDRS